MWLQISGSGPEMAYAYGFYMHTVPASMCSFGGVCLLGSPTHCDTSATNVLNVEANSNHHRNNIYQLLFQSTLNNDFYGH